MAVEPTPSGFHDALLEGRLRIDEHCVFVANGDREFLLVWPSNESAWDDASNSVVFNNMDQTVTLADGEDVRVGGSSFGVSGPDWVSSVEWISVPDPSCPVEIGWRVGGIHAL